MCSCAKFGFSFPRDSRFGSWVSVLILSRYESNLILVRSSLLRLSLYAGHESLFSGVDLLISHGFLQTIQSFVFAYGVDLLISLDFTANYSIFRVRLWGF